MSIDHVSHSQIATFAEDYVNLPREKASAYRDQVRRLREKLDGYLSAHPDFSLRKTLLSGSLAKSTALRSLNDIDVACYIDGAQAPKEIQSLLDFLAERLRAAFPNFSPDQVAPQTFSVTVSFRGSGLDVDIVPILYSGDPDWYGDLVDQDDTTNLLRTSIPRHLEFSKKRRLKHDGDFAQVARLVKSWAALRKAQDENFRFKSFMIELILSHLSDTGTDFSNYVEAMQSFFTYIAKTGLSKPIFFCDWFDASAFSVVKNEAEIFIFDPVNPDNNVASLYTAANVAAIVDASLEAGDAIDSASHAPTKSATIAYWRKVFGPSFSV